jgi:hypothetical protein
MRMVQLSFVIVALLATVVVVPPAGASALQLRDDRCSWETTREASVSAEGIRTLTIAAGSGELRVEGEPGVSEITIVGLVCASREEDLGALRVSVADLGSDGLEIVTHYPEDEGWTGRGRTARIDLTVRMPLGMAVEIEDSSGEMTVSGTGSLRIGDSSGSIRVARVQGDLRIDDSSGDVEIADVAGDVDIDDSSGGLEVRDVRGVVSLRDGSGAIDVSDVGRDVFIESDGSGGINVREVGGDFVVERDGSGGIRHSGVRGTVDVPVRRRRGGSR